MACGTSTQRRAGFHVGQARLGSQLQISRSGHMTPFYAHLRYSLGVVEDELCRFLRTRTHVFPRLNLSLLSRSPFGLSKALGAAMVTSAFPQVQNKNKYFFARWETWTENKNMKENMVNVFKARMYSGIWAFPCRCIVLLIVFLPAERKS